MQNEEESSIKYRNQRLRKYWQIRIDPDKLAAGISTEVGLLITVNQSIRILMAGY